MKVRWAEKAATCLEEISDHIADDNPEAALKTVTQIFQRIEQLGIFPNRGRIGRETGTRELVLTPLPYFAAYRVYPETVEILYIQHGAQER